MDLSRTCLYCNSAFTASRNDKRIIYCKARCREYHWKKLNPERDRILKKSFRDKRVLPCRECDANIELRNRGCGVVFCGDICRKAKRKRTQKVHRDKAFVKFIKYKEGVGCAKCGYNKYSGALDFHHIDPSTKERRVTASMFYSNSYTIKKELKKCILVCKNCHYELHSVFRQDINLYKSMIKECIEKNGDV